MKYSPVVLFVYNRPEHTEKALESLKANDISCDSELFVYADGPKDSDNEQCRSAIRRVRKIIREKDWCGKVSLIESDINKGLANSIIDGVSEIVYRYGKVIVLEDDLVLSPGFLQYMNDALTLYENNEQVMHISGYMYPVAVNLPETFFLSITSCWGWATWLRAWKHLTGEASSLLTQIEDRGSRYAFNCLGSYPYLQQLVDNIEGRLKTWAIKWYASVFLEDGYCLHPHTSLVRNIGMDGSGIHCGKTFEFDIPKLAEHIDVYPMKLSFSKKAQLSVKSFFIKAEQEVTPKSPLTDSDSITLLDCLKTEQITRDWLNIFQIDISDEIAFFDKLGLYECNETGLKFFFPPDAAGSDNLYEELQKFSWYYMNNKWEYSVALKDLYGCSNVLEVGAALGDFVRLGLKAGVNIRGVDFNKKAVTIAQSQGLPIEDWNLKTFVESHPNMFDAVCCFQVLEHMPNPKEFIGWTLQALKPKGKLIVCVPNSESFLKYQYNLLDMPPHHMLRWSQRSLLSLEKLFPIKAERIAYEPLALYHVQGYAHAYASCISKRAKMFQRILTPRTLSAIEKVLRLGVRKYLRGQSIYVRFAKL